MLRNLSPERAVTVFGQTPIAECIMLMKERDVSYLIIENKKHRLIGIFTDGDIRKHYPSIAEIKYKTRPISIFMSRNPKILPLRLIHMAPEFMAKHGIMHVPIMSSSNIDKAKLVGIVTGKSLLKKVANNSELMPMVKAKTKLSIGLLSLDPTFKNSLEKLFCEDEQINIERLRFSHFNIEARIQDTLKNFNILILDVDNVDSQNWVSVVKGFNKNNFPCQLILIYSPSKKEANEALILEGLNAAKKIKVLHKPLDLIAFCEGLLG